MVLPLLAAGAIVGGIGAYQAGKTEQKNARAIQAFKQRKFEMAKQFGTEAYHRFTLEVHTRHRQDYDALVRRTRGVQTQTVQRVGAIAASAATAGVAGVSVTEEIHEEEDREQQALGDIRLQKEFLDVSAELELRKGRARIREQIFAAEPTPTPQVSNSAVIFSTISGSLSGAASFSSLGDAF